jgi:hypothetical protein
MTERQNDRRWDSGESSAPEASSHDDHQFESPTLEPAVELRLSKISWRLAQDFIRLPEFPVLALQRLQPLSYLGGNARPSAAATCAFLTHSLRDCAVQPIFAAIEVTDAQRDAWSFSCSKTSRTARARTSGENLFAVFLAIAPPSQGLEPPANSARFSPISQAELYQGRRRVHRGDALRVQELREIIGISRFMKRPTPEDWFESICRYWE